MKTYFIEWDLPPANISGNAYVKATSFEKAVENFKNNFQGVTITACSLHT